MPIGDDETSELTAGDSNGHSALMALPAAVRRLLDADGTATLLLDLDGSVSSANHAALRLLGADDTDALQPDAGDHSVIRSLLDHAPRHLVVSRAPGTWQGDIDHLDPDGRSRVFRATVTVGIDARMPTGGFIGITAHDVTVARQRAAALRHRATHDPLTGLANRRQVLDTLAHAISRQEGTGGRVAVIFVDVDRLKYVNDTLGHQIGDQLLVSVSRRLLETTRPQDHVARIGGDEFLIVCFDIAGPSDALELAERARRALSGRLRLRQLDLDLSVSLGVALSAGPVDGAAAVSAAAELVSHADTAMYEAKMAGRARSVLYTTEMQSAARERTKLGGELAAAIANRELTISYQPVFSLVTQQAVGAEALVRWTHPTRGPVDPREFISIAEEQGAVGQLGDFVLEQALLETRLWIERGIVGDDFSVHVNVSALQLQSPAFVNHALGLLRGHGLHPSRLVLEADESSFLGRSHDVDRTVRSLRRSGIRVAVDNFGTGASSLSVLTDVGADVLKLDGALGLPVGASDAESRLVRAVILLAHALDMRVVAERVSDRDQLDRLRAAGCDYAQGNLLARPMAPEELVVSISD